MGDPSALPHVPRTPSPCACPDRVHSTLAGTHLLTGEEVGIKLVSSGIAAVARRLFMHRVVLPWAAVQQARVHAEQLPVCSGVQESTKTKHPQLLYESKIYKILQGGSEQGWDTAVRCCQLCPSLWLV